MAVGSMHRDVVEDSERSLVGSCGLDREGNAVRIPRCGHMNY